MDESLIFQVVTFGLAVLGAVLGIINTWKAIDRDRLKIRVRPMPGELRGSGTVRTGRGNRIVVTITNLSSFPVFIKGAGFARRRTLKELFAESLLGKETPGVYLPFAPGNVWVTPALPIRLESRASELVITALAIDQSEVATRQLAYVRTGCGTEVKGSSRAFRVAVKNAALAGSRTGELSE